MLVEDVSKGCVKGERLRLTHLHALLQVEVGVKVSWCPLDVGLACRNHARVRILRYVNPLSAIYDIRREAARECVSGVQVACQRTSAVSRLEDAEVGGEL